MKKSFRIFSTNQCKLCKNFPATRFCKKLNKKICYHCCNKTRIKMECPSKCKFTIKHKIDNKQIILNNYSESIDEQQELTNLHLKNWIKAKNPLFDNKSPLEYAKAKTGKQKIDQFLQKYEKKLNNTITYDYVRNKLFIPRKEKRNPTHEDVAKRFLKLVTKYDYEDTIDLLYNHQNYKKDKKLRENYLRRNLNIKPFKAITEYQLTRSAMNKNQDEAIVEFKINRKYYLSIVLKKFNSRWFIDKKVFGESGVVLSENEYIQRAGYKFTQQKLDSAYHELKRNLEIYPDSADLHYYLGFYYSSKGKIKEAKQYFYNAIELDPEFIKAKYNYAFLFQAEGDMKQAKLLYESILEKKEDPKTLNNLAVIYENEKSIKEASILLKKAIKLQPNFELAQKNLNRINKKIKSINTDNKSS